VHGVDASAEMVAKLHEKPEGDRIPVVIGDFSEAYAGSGFALVVLAYNTIFARPDQQAQVRCFANAARHLRPGGRFVIEAWCRTLVRSATTLRSGPAFSAQAWYPSRLPELDPVHQMMRTTQSVMRNGSVRLHPANHRYAWPAELDLMAQLTVL
jgi:SAM-dependent methyltransferase